MVSSIQPLKITLLIYFTIIAIYTNAQTFDWLWAKSFGGTKDDKGYSIAADEAGNTYLTGSFRSPSITFGNITLTAANSTGNVEDFFIAKFNSQGDVIWAKSAGGTNYDFGSAITTDHNNSIFVTGTFASTSISFDTITLTNNGDYDMFIVKYDSTGHVCWAKSAGGIDSDIGVSVATDSIGNVFVAGGFNSPKIILGADTLKNAGLSAYPADNFIAKYSDSGSVLWARKIGGAKNDAIADIAVDSDGNAIVTGSFASATILLGSHTIYNTSGNYTFFVAKYDGAGNDIFVKSATGSGDAIGIAITTDRSRNIYITGHFQDSIIEFDTTIYLLNTISHYSQDFFVAKFDQNGNSIWAFSEGGVLDDFGVGITSDKLNNLYAIAHFKSPAISIGADSISNAGSDDILIFQFDASGNVNWTKNCGGTLSDISHDIVANSDGSISITGFFGSPTLPFGNSLLTNPAINHYSEIFIAKLYSTVGITEISNLINDILVFPNPSNSSINVQTKTPCELKISNALGQEIMRFKIQFRYEIDMTFLEKGIYFLSAPNGSYSKIIKQ